MPVSPPTTLAPSQALKLVHTEHIPIRWGDMDAMGHVNNTVYFRFMEQARVSLFDRVGLGGGGAHRTPGIGPVVIHIDCTFRRALTYPGTVEVRVFVTETGRTSVTLRYEMYPSYDAQVVYADGTSKGCWIDTKLNKAIKLPAPIIALVAL